MAYGVLSDIQDAAPQLFAQSKPNDGAVNRAISVVHNIVTAQLAALGYSLPVDPLASPQGFAIVKDIEAHGVISRLINDRAFGVSDPVALGAATAEKLFRDALKNLADPDNPFTLPDVAQRAGADTETYESAVISGPRISDPSVTKIDRDTVF
jgi:hypothetical protein